MAKWTAQSIRCWFVMSGISLAQAARNAGLHRSTCVRALRYPLPAGEEAISKVMGIPACELWPDRFDQNGNRLKPSQILINNNRKKTISECQKLTRHKTGIKNV